MSDKEKDYSALTNDFINKIKKFHEDYDYSETKYINTRTRVKIICPKHGPFLALPTNLLRGSGCKKCACEISKKNQTKTKEQFIEEARKVHGDKYDYSQVNYINSLTKVKIRCIKHDIVFEQTPNSHLNNISGCKQCISEIISHNRKHMAISIKTKTTEQFIEEARKVHGDKYDYSLVNYINNKTKVKIICPIHGVFEQAPCNHLENRGCQKCGKASSSIKRSKTKEQFIEEARKVHGDKYDYSQVDYQGTDTKVKIICPIHGVFEQTPNVHINSKHGCKKCANEKAGEEKALTKEQFIEEAKKIHGDKYDYSQVNYINNFIKVKIICPKHGMFSIRPNNHICSSQGCSKCAETSFSKQEKEIVEFIRSFYNGETIENDRKILNGKELDIYIPEYKVAIEYDGLFWHNNIDNSYKFEECRKQGIRLIRISEPEWIKENYKIKSFLKSTFGIFEKKIYARKCEIKEIDAKDYKSFCEENHLQGYCAASVKIGLFYKNELVQITGFGKPRFNNSIEWELIRECSKLGYSIVGGKEKLLKYFERKYNPKNILSYCEKDKFSGKSYYRTGFKLVNESSSNYTYYKKKSYIPLSRINFQKHKLKDKLENFDENLTEWENMSNNGYMRLFDYGNYVFIKEEATK